MIKKLIERKEAEDSLFLRALWLAQAFTCFYLVALVDPNIAFLDIYGLKLPLLLSDFWIAVTGVFLSYHYRHEQVKWLEWLGLIPIAICCTWFVDNLRVQISSGSDIDLLLPTVHLMTGLFVSHSFELRSRFDFNFSLVLSLFLICFAATLGKGAGFGAGMFVFVVLAATLLLLDCEARTFGSVQARKLDSGSGYCGPQAAQDSEKTANLLFPTFTLLGLSIAFFLGAPRAESVADQISAQVYAFVRKALPKTKELPPLQLSQRSRAPYIPERQRTAAAENLLPQAANQPQSKKQEEKKPEERKTANQKLEPGNEGAKPGSSSQIDRKENSSNSPAGRKPQQKNTAEAKGNQDSAKTNSANKDRKGKGSAEKTGEGQAKNKASTSPESKQPASSGSQEAKQKQQGKSQEKDQQSRQSNTSSSKPDVDAANKENSTPNLPDLDQLKNKKQESDKKRNSNAKPKADAKKEMIYTMSDTMDSSIAASSEPVPLFQVSCNRTIYFRQGAFDEFDGLKWHVSEKLPSSELPKLANGNFSLKDVFALALPADVPAIRLSQKFKILNNMGRKVVFAGSPSEIAFGGSNISIDSCGNLKGSWSLIKGLEYTVYADEALYEIAVMRAEGIPSEASEAQIRAAYKTFLQIPENQSNRSLKLAAELVKNNENWFVQAERICSYLRSHYKYSTDPKTKAIATNTVDRFLFESKIGDCKDFASSFVLLCRANGIPARMAVGFTPGDFDPASGTRIIKLNNSHAWGEIYTPNYGWVPFDATPQGTMPCRQDEEERYFSSIAQKVKQGLDGNNQGASESGQSRDYLSVKMPKELGGQIINFEVWDLLKCIPPLVCFVVFGGPIFQLLKKSIGSIAFSKSRHPASKTYLKLRKDLKTLGAATNESQTAEEFLERIRERLHETNSPLSSENSQKLESALKDFVQSYNKTYFGQDGSCAELERMRHSIKELLKAKR